MTFVPTIPPSATLMATTSLKGIIGRTKVRNPFRPMMMYTRMNPGQSLHLCQAVENRKGHGNVYHAGVALAQQQPARIVSSGGTLGTGLTFAVPPTDLGTYASSNTAVATVSPTGVVTAIAYGHATITAQVANLGFSGHKIIVGRS
jgi:hypothetical protein